MGRPQQLEMSAFEQKKINAIESAADKYDEKRRIWQGVGDELTNLKAKLVEVVHANADKVEHGEDSGTKILSYKRGDYDVVVNSGRDKLKVKIGNEPDDPSAME